MPDANPGNRPRHRLPAFLTGGGIATGTHWLVLFALLQLDCQAAIATGVGGAVGLLVNYLFQYHLTFRSARPHREAFLRYLAGAGVGWLFNLMIFDAVFRTASSALTAQTVATGAVTFINFLLADRFVFHDTSIQTPQ